MSLKNTIQKNKSIWISRLDKYLDGLNDVEHSDKLQRKYDSGLHPSQISGCIRQTIYKRLKVDYLIMGKEQRIRVDPKLRRIFDNGTYTHERLQDYFRDMGVLIGRWYCKSCSSIVPQREYEERMPENQGLEYQSENWTSYTRTEDYRFENIAIPVPEQCPHCGAKGTTKFSYSEVAIKNSAEDLEGYTDGVAYLDPEKNLDLHEVCRLLREGTEDQIKEIKTKLWVLEFKSENSFKFKKHTKAHDEHIFQASCYALGLGIDNIAIIYEAKDTQELSEDAITITEADKNRVRRKIEKIRTCERVKEVPEPDDTSKCNYCDFKTICLENPAYTVLEERIERIKGSSKPKEIDLGNPAEDDSLDWLF